MTSTPRRTRAEHAAGPMRCAPGRVIGVNRDVRGLLEGLAAGAAAGRPVVVVFPGQRLPGLEILQGADGIAEGLAEIGRASGGTARAGAPPPGAPLSRPPS